MTTETLMAQFAEKHGWDASAQLAIALEYISNQNDDSCFADFLEGQVATELGAPPPRVHTRPTDPMVQPWVVDVGSVADMKTQAQILTANVGTDREWVAVGIEDEDGFAEVVALTHPSNAPLIAAVRDYQHAAGLLADIVQAELDEDPEPEDLTLFHTALAAYYAANARATFNNPVEPNADAAVPAAVVTAFVETNRTQELWYIDKEFGNCYFFPKGWCDAFTYAGGYVGGPDWTAELDPSGCPELYGYCPTHNQPNSPVDTMFCSIASLLQFDQTTEEEARKRHPALAEYLDTINSEMVVQPPPKRTT